MNDLKLVLWRLPLTHVPESGNLAALNVDWAQNPAMLEHLSDGWVIKSHTLTALPDSLLLSIILEKPIVVPDTPDGDAPATPARGEVRHRVQVPSPAATLEPPPQLLLWDNGTVTWSGIVRSEL